ncbi:7tm 6 domain containing protein, partial [Asbolus verrucosus]
MKDKYDWKDTLRTTIIRMKIVGLWPGGDDTYKFNLYALYSAFCIAAFTFGHTFFQTYNIVYIFNDLKAILGTVYVTLSEVLNLLKAYLVIKNMKILKELMITVNCDLFQPRNQKQLDRIKPDLRFWRVSSFALWSSVGTAIFFWSTYPIFDHSIKSHKLPFLAWYPYRTDISPYYEITYVYQVFGICFTAATAMSVDTLIACLHVYIGAQYDILCDDIKHLYDQTDNVLADLNKKLYNIVKHHREILKFYEHSSKFSNWIIFVQFFISATSIGITMFELTTVIPRDPPSSLHTQNTFFFRQVTPLSSEFFAFTAFLTTITVQIFVYCWFGNIVEVKSSNIPYAVFESKWIGIPMEHKKLMVIFIERNQKPLKVMALDLFFLNLDTFMKVRYDSFLQKLL